MPTSPVPHPPQRRQALIVMDFDGTLYRSTEPLEAYAAAAALHLAPALRSAYLARIAAFLGGDRWLAPGPGPLPADGWSAVARFAADVGLGEAQLQAAFLATRARITAGEFRLEVPDGLADFLAWSRTWCTVVLASNSPPASVLPVLERLDLVPLFDDVRCEASKPTGLQPLGRVWMERFDVPADRVMSVGDHYGNDIAPAVEAGWATAYITPWRSVAGPCSVVGATIEEVLPALRAWVEAITAGADPARRKDHDKVS